MAETIPRLSVVINTKNAADTLARTLESVTFADELIVVDMDSSDETIAIAKKFTQKIFSFEDVGYVEPARNFALSKVSGDWVLIVDADEVVTSELAGTIHDIITQNFRHGELADVDTQADCWYLPRCNVIFDKELEHTGWWPDYQLRLFKTTHVQWSDQIHSVPKTSGTVTRLPAERRFALIHYNYQTVAQFIDRLNRYTDIEAKRRDVQNDTQPHHFSSPISTFSQEFLRRLFAQKGLEDGRHGVGLSLLQSMYLVVTELKQWQHLGFPQQESAQESIQALTSFKRDLAYWIADWQVQHTSGLTQLWWRWRRKARF